MVEPFGCVVMLHWRLHVYGAPVPLPVIPTGSLVALLLSPEPCSMCISFHPLISPRRSPRPSTPMHPLAGVYTVQPSTNGRQSVETECYHWPMCHYCVAAVWQLHNSLAGAVDVTTTHTRFFIFYVGYCSPIRSPFVKSGPCQARMRRNRKNIGPAGSTVPRSKVTIEKNWLFDSPAIKTKTRPVPRLRMKHTALCTCMHVVQTLCRIDGS